MAIKLTKVQDLIIGSLRDTSLAPFIDEIEFAIGGGKMLRARLAMCIGHAAGTDDEILYRSAAAVEMIHAASLLHDDVIDGGQLRRGVPTFWKRKGVSGAVLLGDLLVCKAIEIICGVAGGALIPFLVKFSGEMCDAEVEQELVLRGSLLSWDQCVGVARRKTGSLFAFAGYASVFGQSELSEVMIDAGYKIGTAYQLADDILDVSGDVEMSGKTLGRDAERGKGTAVTAWQEDGVNPVDYTCMLCEDSISILSGFPKIRVAWEYYMDSDIMPYINSHVEKFAMKAAC